MDLSNQETFNIGQSNYSFSAEGLDTLEEMEYTIVTIGVDISGSMSGYEDKMKETLGKIVDACKKSPKKDNILIRLLTFCHVLKEEVGYIPVTALDLDDINFSAYGTTDLYGAAYSAVGSTTSYAEQLLQRDIASNGILFIITDGEDNQGSVNPNQIEAEIQNAIRSEKIESIISVVIGLGYDLDQDKTERTQKTMGFSHGSYFGDITADSLAKLAGFVSRSISSQSQSLGSGQSASLSF